MPDVSTTCWATPRPGEGRARFTGGHRKVLDYHLTNRREILGPLSATWADWLTPALTRGDPRSTPLADRCRGRRRRSRSRGRNRSRRHPEPCLRGAGHVLAPPRGQPKRTVRADHEGERLGQLRRRSPSDPVAESSCRADPAPAAAGPDRGLQPDGSDVSATPPPRAHSHQPTQGLPGIRCWAGVPLLRREVADATGRHTTAPPPPCEPFRSRRYRSLLLPRSRPAELEPAQVIPAGDMHFPFRADAAAGSPCCYLR